MFIDRDRVRYRDRDREVNCGEMFTLTDRATVGEKMELGVILCTRKDLSVSCNQDVGSQK